MNRSQALVQVAMAAWYSLPTGEVARSSVLVLAVGDPDSGVHVQHHRRTEADSVRPSWAVDRPAAAPQHGDGPAHAPPRSPSMARVDLLHDAPLRRRGGDRTQDATLVAQ